MQIHEFHAEYEHLEKYYQAKPNETKKDRMWEKFRRTEHAVFSRAINQWLDTERYFPTPSQLSVSVHDCGINSRISWVGDAVLSETDRDVARAYFPTLKSFLAGGCSFDHAMRQLRQIFEENGIPWRE